MPFFFFAGALGAECLGGARAGGVGGEGERDGRRGVCVYKSARRNLNV